MTLNDARDPNQPLGNAIAFRITRTARVLRLQLLRFLRDLDLDISPEQYLLLFRVVDAPGQTLSELADATLDDKPNLTRLVDGLVRRGLVERAADASDRRKARVVSTTAGSETLELIRSRLGGERSAVVDGIDPTEFEVFVRVLDQIEASAARRVLR